MDKTLTPNKAALILSYLVFSSLLRRKDSTFVPVPFPQLRKKSVRSLRTLLRFVRERLRDDSR